MSTKSSPPEPAPLSSPESRSRRKPRRFFSVALLVIVFFVISTAVVFYAIKRFPGLKSKIKARLGWKRDDLPTASPPKPIETEEFDEIVPSEDRRKSWTNESPVSLSDSGWPGWRGRDFKNVAPSWAGPRDWNNLKEILWRAKLSGRGNSTPIVVSNRAYLTVAGTPVGLSLLAFDFDSGQEIWRQEISNDPFPVRHELASDAAATPSSDGNRVFVTWATNARTKVAAFDPQGQRLWLTDIGPFSAGWGFTSSTAYMNGLVVVSADNPNNGLLATVEADSGEIYWRKKRPEGSEGSYSSPVIIPGDAPHVIIAGLNCVQSYSMGTGDLEWENDSIGTVVATTPVIDGDYCVVSSGYPKRILLALKMDVDRKSAEIAWQVDRSGEVPYVPSPLCHSGRVFVLHDEGTAYCRDLKNGKILWKRRVGGTFSASPVLVGDEILCVDQAGHCTILEFKSGQVRREIDFPDGCFATPVPTANRLLIRTTQELICIGSSTQK